MQTNTTIALVVALLASTATGAAFVLPTKWDDSQITLHARGVHTWWGGNGVCSTDLSGWCDRLCIDEAKRDNINCNHVGGSLVRYGACPTGSRACACACVD